MAEVRSLAFLGDLMLGRGVSRRLASHPPGWFWGDVLPLLRQADFVFANLESPITAHGEPWRKEWKAYRFRADPAAVEILRSGNVGFVSLANNHILDFGDQGLLDTIRALDAAGIRHAGAGRNLEAAAAPAWITLPGLRIAVLAATDNMAGFAAGTERPGTHWRRFDDDSLTLAWLRSAVTQVREAGAQFVILSLHWGPNMRLAPSQRFRRFARAAIDLGVNVIHGHSAHVVQGVERYGGGLILYDTGNVIDDYRKFPFRRDDLSFVFLLDLVGGRPRGLRLVPLRLQPRPLEIAAGTVFQVTCALMHKRCRALGTVLHDSTEGLRLPLEEGEEEPQRSFSASARVT